MEATMKIAAFLLCVITCAAADLSQVRTVYVLPMAGGFDQHLANRIVSSGSFQVVADPKKADAIFTERLGEAFEARLNEILVNKDEKKDEKKDSANAGKQSERTNPTSTFGRGKGTLFLVDAATRNVIWSVYEPPRNTTPKELDRTAQRIVEQLKRPAKSK
jgi:hypothetical protein